MSLSVSILTNIPGFLSHSPAETDCLCEAAPVPLRVFHSLTTAVARFMSVGPKQSVTVRKYIYLYKQAVSCWCHDHVSRF